MQIQFYYQLGLVMVVKHYGINSPEPTRDWYRRVRRKDFDIFKEELEKWGNETKQFNIGTVALCKSKNGYSKKENHP